MADWWIDESLPVGPAVDPSLIPDPFRGLSGRGIIPPYRNGDRVETEVVTYMYGNRPNVNPGDQVWVSPGGYISTQKGRGRPGFVVETVSTGGVVRSSNTITVQYL